MVNKLKRGNLFYGVVLCVIYSLYGNMLFAASVVLSWKPPTTNADDTPLNDLAGYNVYYGMTSGNYSESVDVGDVLTYQVNNLSTGVTYYFATTAYDTSGNESGYSNEMSKTFSAPDTTPPAQGDYYCDSDNDGYMNISKDGSCTGSGCVPAGCQTMQGDDCNDGVSSINPGIVDDTCDGVDNNCDGTADNHYVTAAISCGTGACTSTGQIICQSGTELNTCQPLLPAESTEATCGDGLDNDCDGLIDEGCFPDIKVSNVLLSEDFSSGLPATWSVQGGWSADNPCGKTIGYPFAGKYAIVDSSCTTTDIDEAVTESIDTVSCTSVALTFSNQYYSYSGNFEVDVSNDGGTTWTNNVIIDADDGYPVPDWKELDISSVADVTDAQIKFRYVNNTRAGFWALDNVWITCQSDQLHFSAEMHVPSSRTLMISNTGTDPLTIEAMNIEGPDASEFSIGGNDDCTNQTLLSAETCTVEVVVTPESPRVKNATLAISSNDPDTSVMNVPLEGTVTNILKPVPVIKVNNSSGAVNIARGDNVAATIELDPGSFNGNNADWWVLMEYRNRWYYYDASTDKWRRGYSFYKQGPLEKMKPVNLSKGTRWSSGQYALYFGVDTSMNGIEDLGEYYYDSVVVDVQ